MLAEDLLKVKRVGKGVFFYFLNTQSLRIGDILNNSSPSIFILPTLSCNQNCSYCYLQNKPIFNIKNTLNVELFDIAFRKIADFLIKEKRFSICFHGGEPLLMPLSFYRKAVNIRRLLKKKFFNIDFQVQTNLSLLNKNFAAFFGNEKIRVLTSFDGTPFLQKLNRRNEYNFFTDKLALLKRYCPESLEPLMVTTVITRRSIGRHHQIYNYFKKLSKELNCSFMVELHPVASNCGFDYVITPQQFLDFYKKMMSISFCDCDFDRRVIIGKMKLLEIMLLETEFSAEKEFLDKYLSENVKKNNGLNWLVIGPNGNIFDGILLASKNKMSLGNIKDIQIKEIIRHPLKEKLSKSHSILGACRRCGALRYCRLDPCNGAFVDEKGRVAVSFYSCEIFRGIVNFYRDILNNKSGCRFFMDLIRKAVFPVEKIGFSPSNNHG